MRLNLGCGHHKLDGYVNIDRESECEPDVILDIERFPWPFDDSSVDEILAYHILEHIHNFAFVAKEIYRVLTVGGRVKVRVPHPRSDAFLGDPTHVRPVMPGTLDMFSKKSCAKYRELGWANTPMALYCGTDLELKDASYSLNEPYRRALEAGEISQEQITQAISELNNVVSEIAMTWEKAS